jgi:hypothetical protein
MKNIRGTNNLSKIKKEKKERRRLKKSREKRLSRSQYYRMIAQDPSFNEIHDSEKRPKYNGSNC